MEKSLIATNKKVSNHMYDDIALVILSKLPLKSLIRFLCARKSWSLLFQNPYFMNMFRTNFLSKDHSYYNDTHILLQRIKPWRDDYIDYIYDCNFFSKLYFLFGDKVEKKNRLDWPNPHCEFTVQGTVSVNGILCIQDMAFGPGGEEPRDEACGRFVLWNPSVGEFVETPLSPFAFDSPRRVEQPLIYFYGFGYDRIRNDYKVIQYVTFFPKTDEGGDEAWEIYSLKSHSWKKLDVDIPCQCMIGVGIHVYTDGVCHWWTESESETCDEVYLVSFDLSSEVFVKTSIPSNLDDTGIDVGNDTRAVYRGLTLLNGSICWISNYQEPITTFHISILGEVGVKESWTKLFKVGPLSYLEYPIGVGKKGDIFFKKRDDELVCFDLNTQRIEELGVKGDLSSKIVLYKESLLPFDLS